MSEKKKDTLRTVDDNARRLAKTLTRQGRYASLATLDPIDGSPAASRVSLATAMNGDPVFLISQLSGHFTNLVADQRCSILVGEPGTGDPLAHPRITLIGRAVKLTDGPERDRIKSRYLMRHPRSALYVDFADFAFWRFSTTRVSLNGGFGKAFAPEAGDVVCDMTGLDALEVAEAGAVAHMNDDHADAVDRYAASTGATGTGWKLACIDPEGIDMVLGEATARLWFDEPLKTPDDLHRTLVTLARRLRMGG
ncbi:MAG: HugZ family protein [Hyphomicrobiaceae bacterium]